jgi:hypothetical protein
VSDFVEECRREWKRLHVRGPVANEMAAELAADLREAEVEGASPEELLGDAAFDPQAFARSWAQERGLVADSLPSERRRLRLALLLAAAAVVVGGGIAAGVLLARSPSQSRTPTAVAPTTTVAVTGVPNLIGLKQAEATAAARAAGLTVTIRYRSHGKEQSGYVVGQTPSPGASVPRGSTLSLVVQR